MLILNTKLLLRLLVILVLMGGGLFALHRVQAARLPEALLWQADHAVAIGKPDKAIRYMRRYLEFRPDDHEQTDRLAELILSKAKSSRELANVIFLYEKIFREAPQRQDVGRKLVDLSLRINRPADAQIHLEKLLKNHPEDGSLYAQLGESLILQNKFAEAQKNLEKAIQLSPNHLRGYRLLARLHLIAHNRPDQAEIVLNEMVKLNPTQAEGYLVRGRFLQDQKKYESALKDYSQTLLFDPENSDALVWSAELLQRRGDTLLARETLQAAVSTYPKDVRAVRALSWLELISGNQPEALAVLEKAIQHLPEEPELLTPLADIYIAQNDLDKVHTIISKLEKRKATLQQRYLNARLFVRQSQWANALAILEPLRTESVQYPQLTQQLNQMIALCKERLGDRAGQIEALRRTLNNDAGNLSARVTLANVHLVMGNLDEAVKEYQLASQTIGANLPVQLTALRVRLTQAKVNLAAENDYRTLLQEALKLREKYPHASDPLILTSEILEQMGQTDEAERILRKSLAQKNDVLPLWIALANLLQRVEGTIAAAGCLSEAKIACGDSLDLKLALARLWTEDPQSGSSKRILASVGSTTLTSHATQLALYRGIAEQLALLDCLDELQMICEKALKLSDQTLWAYRELYRIAVRKHDLPAQEKIAQACRKLSGFHPQTPEIWNHLFDNEGPRLGAESVMSLVLKEDPAHLDALKLKCLLDGSERAIELDPSDLLPQVKRLQNALKQDTLATKKVLARLDADSRLSFSRILWICRTALSSPSERGLENFVQALPTEWKKKPQTWLMLGQCFEKANNLSEAENYYRKCNEVASDFVDGWVALAKLLQKEPEKFELVIQKASQTIEGPALFRFYSEMNTLTASQQRDWQPKFPHPEDYRRYAQACVLACEARGQMELAYRPLQRLENEPMASKEDREWAKRTLVVLQAGTGDWQARQDALLELRKTVAQEAATLDESRSRVSALMLAARNSQGEERNKLLKDAIHIMEQLTQDPKASTRDFFQLSQIYRLAGDREAARKILGELAHKESGNLVYAALLVDDLMIDGQSALAEPIVKRLLVGIYDVRIAGAVSRYYTRLNETRRVLDTVERFTRSVDLGTREALLRQNQGAEILDICARLAARHNLSGAKILAEAAESRYRAVQAQLPEVLLPRTALLGYFGHTEMATELLEKSSLNLSDRALAGVGVLRGGQGQNGDYQKVIGWLNEAMSQNPENLKLRLGLAEVQVLRQDFTAAEMNYREILKKEPENLVALNNLAWILSPRPQTAEEALSLIEKAIQVGGASPDLLDTRGRVYISLGKMAEGIQDLNEALNQGQSSIRYFHLALAKWKSGEEQEAKKFFKIARTIGLDPRMVHPTDLIIYKKLASE